MRISRRRLLPRFLAAFFTALILLPFALAQSPPAESAAALRPAGTIQSVAGNTVTLVTDAGRELHVLLKDTTRIVLAAPGLSPQELRTAPVVPVSDLQPGDRMTVRGVPGPDSQSVVASVVLLMKKAAVAERQEQMRRNWQVRSIGGLVSAVDPAAQTATVSVLSLAGKRSTLVRLKENTVIRRYQPNSVKFDEAQPAALADVKPGDQLRARGDRKADGAEFTAEEIVFGSFRNIAGRIASIDAANSALVVNDLATKKPVTVRITSESQMKKLPPQLAARLAARLKGAPASGPTAAMGRPALAVAPAANAAGRSAPGPAPEAESGAARPADLQQMLGRTPDISIAELQKGEAVMLVATTGASGNDSQAITLLTGVETILTASPNGGDAAMLLSPWNLGAGAPDMP
jgi:hypothetical protein